MLSFKAYAVIAAAQGASMLTGVAACAGGFTLHNDAMVLLESKLHPGSVTDPVIERRADWLEAYFDNGFKNALLVVGAAGVVGVPLALWTLPRQHHG